MEKKYEMTNNVIGFEGRILHRVQALKDFGDVKKGDLGGFIEREENLSQEGNAWIYDYAKICDYANVNDNAKVYNSAVVKDNAIITNNACVSGRANICGYSLIKDNSKVSDNAIIKGLATIRNNATILDNVNVENEAIIGDNANIFDNARIFQKAIVINNACVCGNAKIYGHATVGDNAFITDNAEICDSGQVRHDAIVKDCGKISQSQKALYGITKTDLSKDLVSSIRVQCNLPVINNKVIAYKMVSPDFTSFHNKNFKYEVGKIIEEKNCDMTNESCAAGLHFSNLTYWERQVYTDFICLEAEIDMADVITVQEGKIRCKRAKILRAFTFYQE